MERVVYYARVSTEEEQQINALEGQIYELENFINSKDEWILSGKFIDEGKTGTTRKGRDNYNRLFEELDKNTFDIIVIKDLSRLMRKTMDWYIFLDKLQKNNKKLFMYLDNCFYSPENAFITGIKAMMAEEYSRELSNKIKSSAKRNQLAGKVYGNNQIWGYNIVNGKLIINEKEALMVRQIFDLYTKGYGFRLIQKELTERGYFSKTGNIINTKTIKRIITNEKYMGTLICGKKVKDFDTKKYIPVEESNWIVHEDAVPAIVDKNLWTEANKILKSKTIKYKSENNYKMAGRFLGCSVFSSKIICQKCGQVFWHCKYNLKGDKISIWQCSKYRTFGNNKNGCTNITIYEDVLYEILKDIIFDLIQCNNVNFDKLLFILKKYIVNNKSDNLKYELELKEFKLNNKLDSLLNIYIDGDIDKAKYLEKKEKILNEIEQLQYVKKNIKFESNENKLLNLRNIIKNMKISKKEIDANIIESILKSIYVDNNDLNVYLNFSKDKKDVHNNLKKYYFKTYSDKIYQKNTKSSTINKINVFIEI